MAKHRSSRHFFGIFEEMVSRGVGEALPGTVPWLPEVYPIMSQGQMDELNPVLRAAEEVGSPILELGCGTGRLMFPLARQGFRVTGVERSPKMLAILEERLASAPARIRERIQVVPSDMRDFAMETRFRLAFLSANTFLYLVTPENQKEALHRIHEHLEPGGLLLVDTYFPRNGWGSEEPYCRTAFDRQTGDFALYIAQAAHDPLRGTSLLNAATLLLHPGKEPRVWVQNWEEASLTPKEVQLMLEGCGFEVIGMEGDYEGGPLTPDSVQIITRARKAGAAR